MHVIEKKNRLKIMIMVEKNHEIELNKLTVTHEFRR